MFDSAPLAWILFGVYLAATFFLAWLGHRKTDSFAAFAIGRRDMGPGLAGLTLGACLASTATFVINPGFVYAYGASALLALTIPFFIGIFAGLLLLGPGFRKHGSGALTLPRWIGDRYKSEGLRAWFAALNLLNVFYVVLIVVGSAYVMQASMGVSYELAVGIVIAVVFSYVFFGGTYAHAYTNSAQGGIMLAVAAIVFAYALKELLGLENVLATDGPLAAGDSNYLSLTHPGSPFYRNAFEVFVCPFVMGFAVVAQPHLLIKSLYLKRSSDTLRFLLIGGGCFVIFSLVLLAGLAARGRYGAELAQDVAASKWIAEAFPGPLGAVVGVAILAAAMSTLDGLLVAISSIVGADLVDQPAMRRLLKIKDDEAAGRAALHGGRIAIVVLGVVAWVIALNPPKLVGIFGQVGVFGLLAATVPAILYGVLRKAPPRAAYIAASSVIGLAVHLTIYLSGVINTSLTATVGLLVALPVPLILEALSGEAVAASEDQAEDAAARSEDLLTPVHEGA